jgi:F0F1-type ATP synthase membrane subunit b/b'
MELLDNLGLNLKIVAVQAGIFLALFFVLNGLLFGRTFAFMKEREEESKRIEASTASRRAEIGALGTDYDARMTQVEKDAYASLQAGVKEALAQKQRIVAESQQQVQERLRKSRGELAAARDQASSRLQSEVVQLAMRAAEKVLDRPLEEDRTGRLTEKKV